MLFGLCIISGLFLLGIGFLEYLRVYSIIDTIEKSVEKSAYHVVSTNYDNTFAAFREGYAGAYKYYTPEWAETVFKPDVIKQSAQTLDATQDGATISKIDVSGTIYEIKNIMVDIVNIQYAGTSTHQFKATINYRLILPWFSNTANVFPPLTLNRTVSTIWNAKF